MRMALTGEMLDESASFAMDNGREASHRVLHNCELLVLYTYQTSQEKVSMYSNRQRVRTRQVRSRVCGGSVKSERSGHTATSFGAP